MKTLFLLLFNSLFNKNTSFFSLVYNSKLDKHSYVHRFSKVSNSSIGAFSYIAASSVVNNCSIGNFCSISQNVKIGLGKHPTSYISSSPVFYSAKNATRFSFTTQSFFKEFNLTLIGHDVWIGGNVILLDGIKVGNGAIVGAGSIVTKNVPPYAIVGGVPAKILKYRFNREEIEILEKAKWWNWESEVLRNKLFLFQETANLSIINSFKDK